MPLILASRWRGGAEGGAVGWVFSAASTLFGMGMDAVGKDKPPASQKPLLATATRHNTI